MVAGYIPWTYIRQEVHDPHVPPTYSARHRKQPALVALGEAIKRVRSAIGISQEELALRAGIDRGYMGGVERGESNTTVLNLVKIAAVMNLAASELLEQAGL